MRTIIACICLSLFVLFPIATHASTKVLLKTNKGDISLELQEEKAPVTVANFIGYVKSGHYNGTIFHRVINKFMIQGGGLDKDMHEKPTLGPIKNEANNGLKNEAYAIAMAREDAADSATAQFYINVVSNPHLDYPNPDGAGYCVFGKVIAGKEIVDAIKIVPTDAEDVPLSPVIIEAATLIDENK